MYVDVLSLNYPDFYEDPMLYEWENQPIVNQVSNLQKYDNVFNNKNTIDVNNNNDVQNEKIAYDKVNKKKEEKQVKKKDDVKHFLKGVVNKVQSWFGKKTESKSHAVEPVSADTNVFSGIIKGIHNFFKKSEAKVIEEPLVRRQRNVKLSLNRGWYETSYGITPENVFVAGHTFDGYKIFIAKARVNDSTTAVNAVVPGMLRDGKRCVRVVFNKWARCVFHYKILVGNSYVWFPYYHHTDTVWTLHPHALVGGKEELEKGVFVDYICRARHLTMLIIGKLQIEKDAPNNKMCIVPYRGKTEAIKSYDILIDWWE